MSGVQRRPAGRRTRARALDQHLLTDRAAIGRLLATLDLEPGELVVDLGAGDGALTRVLAAAGVDVWAVEIDPRRIRTLEQGLAADRTTDRVRVIRCDLRRLRLPARPYRVVANPPWSLTSEVLTMLFADPLRGPERADLIVQRGVAVTFARTPPESLRVATLVPWWTFDLGPTIDRRSFRPPPSIDGAVLTIRRRSPPVLPPWLAAEFGSGLREAWVSSTTQARRRASGRPRS